MAPKVFGWQHIVYLLFFIALGVGSIVFIKLKVKDEKKLSYIIKGVGAVLFCLVAWNRILHAMHYGLVWLIPNTFCGLTSVLFGLAAIFLKKDNISFHFFIYMSLWGCTMAVVYPSFIGQSDSFLYPLTISGLLHHTVSLYLAILMIVTGYFKPTIHKFYAFPIGMAFYMSFGVFLMDCFGYEKAMNINEPLVDGTIFTWYFVGFLICIVTAAILFVLDYIKKKKANKLTDE
jgi:hypothetical protein